MISETVAKPGTHYIHMYIYIYICVYMCVFFDAATFAYIIQTFEVDLAPSRKQRPAKIGQAAFIGCSL